MIAIWNTHLLIASLTLAVLASMSILLTRKTLNRQPSIAHGFLVFVLLAFVITLPLQLSSKSLLGFSSKLANDKAQQAESTEKSRQLMSKQGPWPVPFDYFDRTKDEKEVGVETERFLADEFPAFDEVEDAAEDRWDALDTASHDNDEQIALAEDDLAEISFDVALGANDEANFTLGDPKADTRPSDYDSGFIQQWTPRLRSPWLLLVYALGLMVALTVELLRYRKTNRIIDRSQEITDERTLHIWREVAGPAAERVQLLASSDVRAPVCWGVKTPVVIIPMEEPLGRETAAFRWAIRHELVHLERGDTRTTIFQSVLRSLFWFHPASWWLNREIDRLREISCDDAVVGQSGSRRSYAMALIEYARRRDARANHRSLSPSAPALISWSGSTSQLERRIKMLAQSEDTKPRGARLLQAAGAVGLALVLMSAQITWAARMPNPQSIVLQKANDPLLGDSAPLPDVQAFPPPHAIGQDNTLGEHSTGDDILMDGTQGRVLMSIANQNKLTIGVHLQPFSGSLTKTLGMPAGSGLIITKVVKGSPAERAGLKDGDPILKIDGKYASMKQIRSAKKNSGGRKPIKFLVMRGAKTQTLTVRFARVNTTLPRGSVSRVPTAKGGRVMADRPLPGLATTDSVRSRVSRDVTHRGTNESRNRPRTPRVTGIPAPNSQKKLEREVRNLNRRIDRLTRSLERQGQMLERLMKEPRYRRSQNSRSTERRQDHSDARSNDRSDRKSYTTATNVKRLRQEGAELKARREFLAAKNLAAVAVENARRDKELATARATLKSDELIRLAELNRYRRQQEGVYKDLLAKKSSELAKYSSQLRHAESSLAQLNKQYTDLAATRAHIAGRNLEEKEKVKVQKSLAKAEEDLKEQLDSLRKLESISRERASIAKQERNVMVAEFESKIADLESQTQMLRQRLEEKKSKATKKRVILFDDDTPGSSKDK